MTVREIYRLRHQKAVGFNRARSRVIEQLVAQRGECTDTAIFAALRDELARITADEAQMNAEMNTLLRASLADMGIDPQIAEKVFLYPKAHTYACCYGVGWYVTGCYDSPKEIADQNYILRKVNAENENQGNY